MKLADLPKSTLKRISDCAYDRFIEKHEGPWPWDLSLFGRRDSPDRPDFLAIGEYQVLLPVPRDHHPNITALRTIVSRDEQSLTIFLKDTTLAQYYKDEPDSFYAGFVAICDRLPGENFFVAIFYHEWYIGDSFTT